MSLLPGAGAGAGAGADNGTGAGAGAGTGAGAGSTGGRASIGLGGSQRATDTMRKLLTR